MIRNKINQILDTLPEDELQKVYWSIDFIQRGYLFRKNLQDKGVVISELYDESQEIIELWDNTFAKHINGETREAIYYDQYKWHIFSYEKQVCLKEEEARQAFDAEAKDDLYVMYQNSPLVLLYTNAGNVIATDFDTEQDIYLFDRQWNWTYVHTHESMCGPYFYKVKD